MQLHGHKTPHTRTYLTPNRSLERLPVILGCFHRFLFIFRLLVAILPVLFS